MLADPIDARNVYPMVHLLQYINIQICKALLNILHYLNSNLQNILTVFLGYTHVW